MAKDRLLELTDELIRAMDGTTEKPRSIPSILREIEGVRGDRQRPFMAELRQEWYAVTRNAHGDFERERRRLVDLGLASPTEFDIRGKAQQDAAIAAGLKDAEEKRKSWEAIVKAGSPAQQTRAEQLEEAMRRADVAFIG